MKNKYTLLVILLVLAESLFSAPLPVTGQRVDGSGHSDQPTHLLLPLHDLVHNPSSNSPGQIARVTVKGLFSYPVVDQPLGDPGYVSPTQETITRFRLASDYGSTGLLAHNYLAGAEFFELGRGDLIDLVDLSSKSTLYMVYRARRFQATNPYSAYSDFIDLESGYRYSTSELFMDIYGRKGLLIFQTCIEEEGIDSWGRLFVIAIPVTTHFPFSWPDTLQHYIENPN